LTPGARVRDAVLALPDVDAGRAGWTIMHKHDDDKKKPLDENIPKSVEVEDDDDDIDLDIKADVKIGATAWPSINKT
jgi:hypothetical protein